MQLPFARTLVRIAAKNVRRNLRHSLAALLSIVVGFVSIGLFDGYIKEMMASQVAMFEHRTMYGQLVVERRHASSAEGQQDPLKYALGAPAQAFLDGYLRGRGAEVRDRARFITVSGMATRGPTSALFMALGYDVEAGARLRREWAWDTIAGQPLHLAGKDAIVLGKGLAASLDCVPTGNESPMGPEGRPIPRSRPFSCAEGRIQLTATTETGQLNVLEPRAGGITDLVIRDRDDRVLFMPLGMAQSLLDTRAVTMYTIDLADGVDPAAFAAALGAQARQQGLDLDIGPWWEHPSADLVRRGMDLLGMYRSFVVLVVVTIAGMSVLTMMMRSVSERTREIGTLRSLGFQRGHVLVVFAVEAVLLAGLAVAIGVVTTASTALTINALHLSYKGGVLSAPIPLAIKVSPSSYLLAGLFLSAVAAGAAVLATRRAVKLRIPAALGHA